MTPELSPAPMSTPSSVEEALDALDRGGGGAVPVAGATWVMRAPLRREPQARGFVALSRVEGFLRLDVAPESVTLGPLVTHERLAHALPATPDLRALARAAGRAANPGVRRLATIGGNLCADAFAASDLAPALLSLEAEVEIATLAGRERIPVEAFLARRADRSRPWLLTAIIVPRRPRLGAHERLPMRRAGDYPCAIVSVSIVADEHGLIRDARIAVGAVEPSARRWRRLEAAIEGARPEPAQVERLARSLVDDFNGREAVDAPGWYRTAVLPVLIRRAFETIQADLVARAP